MNSQWVLQCWTEVSLAVTMENLGFNIADSLKAEQRTRADRPRGLLLCLAPQSGACSPEWVCGCSSICRDVGRPRCFFRSHSGNRAVERVQSQAFCWQYERSQPVLNAVVRIHRIFPYLFKNDIILEGIIVCIVVLR